jgi:hypothetical protein
MRFLLKQTERKVKDKDLTPILLTSWIAIIFPVPVIFFTPVNMISKWGLETFLDIRLVACITIVAFALAQIVIAIKPLKEYK